MKFIGDRIRELREEKMLLQKHVISHFNVQESTWSQYENNKRTPDVDMIKKIAEYFNVSTDYLIGITDFKYNPLDRNFILLIEKFMKLNDEEKKSLF